MYTISTKFYKTYKTAIIVDFPYVFTNLRHETYLIIQKCFDHARILFYSFLSSPFYKLSWWCVCVPGQALIHVLEENLKEEVGARSDTPQFLLLLTDGKSQDDAVAAASKLKNAGVEIITVGETGLLFPKIDFPKIM